MPRYEITSPDGRRFEITAPEGASREQVLAYAQSQFKPPKEAPVSPTDEMSGTQKFLAGVGKGFVDIGRGARQMVGLADQQEIDEARKMDAPLLETGAGAGGHILGQLTAALPALAVPGANTVGGAALLGGAMNALQPTAGDESRLKNVALGAALGGGSQAAIGKLAQMAGNRLAAAEASGAKLAAQNAPRDAAMKASQDAGYLIPPDQAGAGMGSKVLYGISGKMKTNQAMGAKNQNVTETLARKAVGLADDAPITREAMRGLRQEAVEAGYSPIRAIDEIVPDGKWAEQAKDLTSRADNASKAFGDIVKSDLAPLAEGLKNVRSFNGSQAVDQIAIFREASSDLYASGNKTLGKAYRKAAEMIEGQIERHLAGAGEDGAAALKAFREARQKIAKTGDIEKALSEGGGQVNAKVLGAMLKKGRPLSGELETIAKFANAFPDVAGVPKSGWQAPITALDAFGAAGMAGMGAGPAAIALPAARMGARGLLTNPSYQRAFVGPNYDPSMMTRLTPKMLEELERTGMAGLMGSVYAAQ